MEESVKNMDKYRSYKLAFERIKIALEQGFPLEAITIEESIITDRLRAYSELVDVFHGKDGEFRNLGFFIGKVEEVAKQDCPELSALICFVKNWKDARNTFLHGMVKTETSGMAPDIPADVFVSEAMKIAEDGYAFARDMCNISGKFTREVVKTKKVKES